MKILETRQVMERVHCPNCGAWQYEPCRRRPMGYIESYHVERIALALDGLEAQKSPEQLRMIGEAFKGDTVCPHCGVYLRDIPPRSQAHCGGCRKGG